MHIYMITNLINGKKYIGKCQRSLDKSRNYFGSGVLIKESIKEIGKNNFVKDILEDNIKPEELSDKEIFWISYLKTKYPNGYNLTDGGGGFNNISQISRSKISEALKNLTGEKSPRYGSRNTPEHREKISHALKGRTLDSLVREKISKKLKGRIVGDDIREKMSVLMTGKTVSEEIKYNIKMHQPNRIRIEQYDRKTGDLIKIYDSLHDAQRETGVSVPNISAAISKHRGITRKYIWKRID